MKTTQRQHLNSASTRTKQLLGLALVSGVLTTAVRAELPAPDNILYGTITLGSQPVTDADTNIIVEARRTLNGPAIASYRMGSDAAMGGFYRLNLKLEELDPVTESDASRAGESIVLVILNQNGVQMQLPYQIPERGHAQRLDFGTTVSDSDNDGLPDLYELSVFGNLNPNGTGDEDNDGVKNKDEYTAGTNPNDRNGFFHLSITRSGPVNKLVSFFAVTAAGAGYAGYDRIYTLESTTNLLIGNWRGVPNYTNLLGNNSTVTYVSNEPDAQTFYRCRLQLRNR